jgi:hypothetical protein
MFAVNVRHTFIIYLGGNIYACRNHTPMPSASSAVIATLKVRYLHVQRFRGQLQITDPAFAEW